MDFEEIYTAYFKDVFVYLKGLSADECVAEELTQETFSKALSGIGNFDGRKDIRAWLFTIAKNTYFTFCSKQKRFAQADFPAEVPDLRVAFTDRIEDNAQAFQIHKFLHTMKEPYKEVFYLRVFGELPFEKIGLLFGKSAGWARVTYHRARLQIIAYMEELEHE